MRSFVSLSACMWVCLCVGFFFLVLSDCTFFRRTICIFSVFLHAYVIICISFWIITVGANPTCLSLIYLFVICFVVILSVCIPVNLTFNINSFFPWPPFCFFFSCYLGMSFDLYVVISPCLVPYEPAPKLIVITGYQPQKYCHRSLPAPKVLSLQWTSPKSIVSIIYQPRKYYHHDVPVLLPLLSDFSVCEVVQVTSACRREGIVFSRSETLARRSVHVWGKSVCCYGVFAVRSTVWSRIRVGSSAQSAAKVSQGKLNNSGHLAN